VIKALRFRRRLAWTWVAVAVVLLVAFYYAIRVAGQAMDQERWVAHTQDVLKVIADGRLKRARVANHLLAFRMNPQNGMNVNLGSDLRQLHEDLDSLRTLTADNPAQQNLLTEIESILKEPMSAAERYVKKAPVQNLPSSDLGWSGNERSVQRLQAVFDQMEKNERDLLETRSASVRTNAQLARVITLFAACLSFLILALAGYFIQREIIHRGEIETGLRKARELLGVELEGQRAELGHTMEDLHAQIEARRQMEREVRQLNEDLEERVEQRTRELQEANHELESFSYSVSHDLRAPLRHMDGFSRILQQEYGTQLPEEARHYLDRVRSATTHMSNLVEDLLQLSRLGRQSPQLSRVSLHNLLAEAQTEALSAAGDRTIEWRIGDLPEAEIDANLFRQVWINLLSNAIKFSRNHSKPVIEIGTRKENGETILFVRDNGAGFDPRYADKLFGVFQRLHRQDEFEGTGIGLATVQRIIKKHGGRVWAESQPGQGATFYFTIPTVAGHPEIHETIGARA
jgi:signal transduction histidine kinase